MTSPRFEDPQLFVKKAADLPLSGHALFEIMRMVLDRGLPFRFRARGWSMAPFIKDGDVITVAPLHHSTPGIGDVVAYIRPDEEKLVVHRIIATRSKIAILLGDNGVEYQEELIPQENVLGKVTRIERTGRNVLIGLGPERYMIAWLSRARLLTPIGNWLSSKLSRSYQRNK